MPSSPDRPIFIVGIPRSGTTLLQVILSRSGETYTFPETHYFESVLPAIGRGAADALDGRDVARALELLAEMMEFRPTDETRRDLLLQSERGELSGQTLFDLVLEQYRPQADTSGQRRPVEKTPGHVQHLNEIATLYPEAKFIHIVREPRNAISSLLQTPFVKTRWLVWHCARWNATVGYANRFAEKRAGSLLTVRYEDLVEESEATVRAICLFLGITYSSKMLEFDAPDEGSNVALAKETWKQAADESVKPNRQDAWLGRIRSEEGWFIGKLTRRLAASIGYGDRVSLGAQAKTAVQWQQWMYLRSNPSERGTGMWLLNKCLEMEEAGPARQLALGLVVGDARSLSQRDVRSSLFW